MGLFYFFDQWRARCLQLDTSDLKYSRTLFTRHVKEQNMDVITEIVSSFLNNSHNNFLETVEFDVMSIIPAVIRRLQLVEDTESAAAGLRTLWSIIKLDHRVQSDLIHSQDSTDSTVRISDAFR